MMYLIRYRHPMPRQARMDATGALHHIIIRGIERKAIFMDNADRANFVERIGRIITESETDCYAWALMTNHVHLLLKTGLAPIATVMRRLLTGYAVSLISGISGVTVSKAVSLGSKLSLIGKIQKQVLGN